MLLRRGRAADPRTIPAGGAREEPPADPGGHPRIHNAPAPGQWAPIVVDEPADSFDPRPAPGRQPDTVCDGWTTPDFVVRMASVRGNAHRYAGKYRQDDAGVVLHRPTGAVLFAVMDGVSDTTAAEVGARLAGQAALRALAEELDRDGRVDWRRVLTDAAGALLGHGRYGLRPGERAEDVERRLGTTIVTGVVRPTRSGATAELVRAGDSGAWSFDGSRFSSLFPSKYSDGGMVDSAVTALPRLPERIEPVGVRLSTSVLLIGTDGFGDPLGDGTGLVGDLFAAVLDQPPPMLGLAHALDFSRDTFDDDRTLVAVWPRPRRSEGAG
ncbi:protein phosphatase 2C domain-containing protein [Plantactinospora veratri]|uniref:Protein phosphatase 2C domain-containing protein n=1 Tax=Plantactinospora veratri TaxID=1436122 RepID=A0ABU7S9G3_9ACTN